MKKIIITIYFLGNQIEKLPGHAKNDMIQPWVKFNTR